MGSDISSESVWPSLTNFAWLWQILTSILFWMYMSISLIHFLACIILIRSRSSCNITKHYISSNCKCTHLAIITWHVLIHKPHHAKRSLKFRVVDIPSKVRWLLTFLDPQTRGRLNFAKRFGDNGSGCLRATKMTRFFRGFICEIWPSWRVYRRVARRHPGPLSPNHLAKFKRPHVLMY